MADVSAAQADTVQLGDLTVNRLGFGAMRITGEGIWGPPKDHNEALAVLKRAVELGVDFIDTADAYGPEVSENLIAEALRPYPKGLVIATKGGLTRSGPGVWMPDGRPEHLRQAIDGSLQRLGVERIDLYQFHRPDPKVPFADSVRALVELQREGKIRHIGLSNVTVAQLHQALGLTPIVSVQNAYNITSRENQQVLKACEEKQIAFIPYFPIAAGRLGQNTLELLNSIAATYHATVNQIALAWLLAISPIMLPIPGTSSVEHLEENIAAAGIKLNEEELQALETAQADR